MDNKKTPLQKGKILQAVLGLFLLIPPVLGVIFFVISVFCGGRGLPQLFYLSVGWTARLDGGMSAAPVYLGLMALAGSYLIKDSLQYFFNDDK